MLKPQGGYPLDHMSRCWSYFENKAIYLLAISYTSDRVLRLGVDPLVIFLSIIQVWFDNK